MKEPGGTLPGDRKQTPEEKKKKAEEKKRVGEIVKAEMEKFAKEVKNEIEGMKREIEEMKEALKKKSEEAEEISDKLETKAKKLMDENEKLKEEMKQLKEGTKEQKDVLTGWVDAVKKTAKNAIERAEDAFQKSDSLENRDRRNNILIGGEGTEQLYNTPVKHQEAAAIDLIEDVTGIRVDPGDVARGHFTGNGKHSPFVIKLEKYKVKEEILIQARRNRENMAKKKLFIKEDFSFEVRAERKVLAKLMSACYDDMRIKARLNFRTLMAEGGRTFYMDDGNIIQGSGAPLPSKEWQEKVFQRSRK